MMCIINLYEKINMFFFLRVIVFVNVVLMRIKRCFLFLYNYIRNLFLFVVLFLILKKNFLLNMKYLGFFL